jgi:ribosomal protein S18 acetylase RimI-like enzyme
MPLFPLPGWKEKARESAIAQWATSREKLLKGDQAHALLVALRNEADSGRYFEGVEDSLLGFAEMGLLPAPPEKTAGQQDDDSSMTAAEAAAAEAAAKEAAANPELYPYLANLAVKSGARRIGLGKALVEATEATASSLGFNRIYIKVDRTNFDARRLYDKLGYRLVYMQNKLPDQTNRQLQLQFLFLRKELEEQA